MILRSRSVDSSYLKNCVLKKSLESHDGLRYPDKQIQVRNDKLDNRDRKEVGYIKTLQASVNLHNYLSLSHSI